MEISNHLIAKPVASNIVHLDSKSSNSRKILTSHINESLALIKTGKYEDAINNLENQTIAKEAGFNLICRKVRLLNKLATKEEVYWYLGMTADCSSFSRREKKITINKLVSLDDLLVDINLKEVIKLEESLLFAEEWTHALQDIANGEPISSHGKEIYSFNEKAHEKDKIDPVEIEVADYFLEQGLSWDFLKETNWITRYDRKQIVSNVLGISME